MASIASVAHPGGADHPHRAGRICHGVLHRGRGRALREWAPVPWAPPSGVQDLFYNTHTYEVLKKDSSGGRLPWPTRSPRLWPSATQVARQIHPGKANCGIVCPGDGQLRGAWLSMLGREFSRTLWRTTRRASTHHQESHHPAQGFAAPAAGMQRPCINGRYVPSSPHYHGRHGDGVQRAP